MITVTAKIQILPTSEQQELLLATSARYTVACNFVSEYIYKTKNTKQHELMKALYYGLRDRFGLRSQMACSVVKTVIASYRAIKETTGVWTQPEYKRSIYDLVWNRDYSLNQKKFSVNTLKGRIKLDFCTKGMEKYFDGTWQFGTAKLVHKYNKWFLHVPMTKDIPQLDDFDVKNVVGVDLGVNFLATAYGSNHKTTFWNGRQIKHKRAKYKEVRKQLQRRQTPSARRRLKKIGSRENRWVSDVNHQVTKALIEANPSHTLFCLEDLTGVRSATEKVRRKDRYVLVSWAFYDFRKKLEYKAQLHGSKVLVFDPAYTSQTCPVCGHTEQANRNKKNHIFACKRCGYRSNDDRIGAMNLYRKGIEYLSTVTAE